MSNLKLHFRNFEGNILVKFLEINQIKRDQILEINSHGVYFYAEEVMYDLAENLTSDRIEQIIRRNIHLGKYDYNKLLHDEIIFQIGATTNEEHIAIENNRLLFFPVHNKQDSMEDSDFYSLIKKLNPAMDIFIRQEADRTVSYERETYKVL